MQLILSAVAAFCFALGGVFMKQADGIRHASAAFVFLFLFASGAVLQSEAMRGAGLALTCVLVLGLEAATAVGCRWFRSLAAYRLYSMIKGVSQACSSLCPRLPPSVLPWAVFS
jgi:hypothetical protein